MVMPHLYWIYFQGTVDEVCFHAKGQTIRMPSVFMPMTYSKSTMHEILSCLASFEIDYSFVREYMTELFMQQVSLMLARDVEMEANAAEYDYNPYTDNLPESIDRIVSNVVERRAVGSIHSGWHSPYGQMDRDDSTVFDSVVISASQL